MSTLLQLKASSDEMQPTIFVKYFYF